MISRVKTKCSLRSATLKAIFACLTLCALASAQLSGTTPQSPKRVVATYRRVDANGERLTTSGWKKCNVFFLHPGFPPRDRVIGVMAGEIVGEATVKGDKAEVWTEFDFLGKVYPTGRFSRSLDGSPPVKGPVPSSSKYRLILVDQHSNSGAGEAAGGGASRWKIEDFASDSMVKVNVAIRYLERLRDKSDNDDVKKNAERSIAELMALQNKNAK